MIGEVAENFKLKDQYGKDFELYKNLDKNILLVFYPKDNSTVCSKQLYDYQLNLQLFEENNCKPVGINIDSFKSHEAFCEKKGIEFPLLSDINKIVSKRFGALNFMGINKRKLILVGMNKKILYEENNSYLGYSTPKKIMDRFSGLKILQEV